MTQTTAAVLSIGTELTRGEITNTNQSWLASQLTALGVEVTHAETVADDPDAIIQSLRRLGERHRLIVSTGGLGPTTDDLTSETVAALLGVPVSRDQESLEIIRKRVESYGNTLTPSNAKQADFPQGSTILSNSVGSAPGFAVDVGGARAFFMPGVPHEMRAMFSTHVADFARSLNPDTHVHQVRLRTFGLPESKVNDLLSGVEEAQHVIVGYRAHFPEIEVKLLARRTTLEAAKQAARAAADETKQRLGEIVYGEGDAGLPEVVGQLLLERGLSLVTAESCTGGLVSKLITDVAGSSRYFTATAVTYTNASKHYLLGVDQRLLEVHGAVSAEVAAAMARGALDRLGGDVSIALTGIAGPAGGTAEKPVGLVHYAVATRAGAPGQTAGLSQGKMIFGRERERVRTRAAWEALALLRRVLLGGHAP
ncbi:MAG: competence/damage-inducible protein A [Myxococcales bacterium]|nr:competence/damage-inducible protein A [Myxococcales bacterium]